MRKLKITSLPEDAPGEALLRPEPKQDEEDNRGGLGLLGVALAACALFIVYVSTPVDAPEWPDCPIQSLGSCGER